MFVVSILTRGMKFWSLKHPKGWTHSSQYPWVMIFAREKTLLKQPSTALWQISALPANQKVLKNSVSRPVRIWLARSSQVSFFGHVFFFGCYQSVGFNWDFFRDQLLSLMKGKATPHNVFFPQSCVPVNVPFNHSSKQLMAGPERSEAPFDGGSFTELSAVPQKQEGVWMLKKTLVKRLVEGRWRNWYGVQTIQE